MLRCTLAFMLILLAGARGEDEGELCGTEPTPACTGTNAVFEESFNDNTWRERWTIVNTDKYQGKWLVEVPEKYHPEGDSVLRASNSHKFHGIYAKLDNSFETSNGLYFQYEVKYLDHKEMNCGGSYAKLLSHPFSPKTDLSDAPFSIMFGPDYCGVNNNKVHFIFRVADSVSGEFAEHHLVNPPQVKLDSNSHVYALKLSPDDSFEIFIDGERVRSGSLYDSFEPPVNPPEEISDLNDIKPEDWDDRTKIKDPEAVKPEDWDEFEPYYIPDETDTMPEAWDESAPVFIPDATASPPEEWDVKEDGEWAPPQIVNPKCATGCGPWKPKNVKNPNFMDVWHAPTIPNPAYKGEWEPRLIPNPDFYHNPSPTSSLKFDAIALEIWVTNDVITFDNFLLSTDGDGEAGAAATKAKAELEKKLQLADQPEPETPPDEPDEPIDYLNEIGLFIEDNPVLACGGALAVIVLLWYGLTSGGTTSKTKRD